MARVPHAPLINTSHPIVRALRKIFFGLFGAQLGLAMGLSEEEVRLSDIHSSVFACAGKSDNMVTQAAVETLMDHISSSDKEFTVVAGGHMGILSGSKAPNDVWKKVADWLDTRSA